MEVLIDLAKEISRTAAAPVLKRGAEKLADVADPLLMFMAAASFHNIGPHPSTLDQTQETDAVKPYLKVDGA